MMALQIVINSLPKNKHTVSIYEPNNRQLTKHIRASGKKTDLLIKKKDVHEDATH